MNKQFFKNLLNFDIKNSSIALAGTFLFFGFINTLLPIISFTFHSQIKSFFFPLSVALSILFLLGSFYFLIGKEKFLKYTFWGSIIFFVAVVKSYLISGYFYDVSWDGQMYHQEAIIQLVNGWNPIFAKLTDNQHDWILNHYAKASWYAGASVYAFCGKIENGKLFTWLFMAASFLLSFVAIKEVAKISFLKTAFFAFLLAFNPITLNQTLSYYIDGQLASLLLSLISIFILIFQKQNKSYLFLLMFFIISVFVNLKFTALGYAGILCIGFALIFLVQKQYALFIKHSISMFFIGIIAVVFIGYNPYVTNTVNHQHPFFPLNTMDLLTGQIPTNFENQNRFYKLYHSTFSEAGAFWREHTILKFPFDISDFKAFKQADSRISGFGSLFGATVIITALLFFYLLRKGRGKKFHLIWISLAIIIFSAMVNPEVWWARYVPQLYFIPVFVALLMEVVEKNKVIKIFYFAHLVALVLNIGIIVWVYYPYNYKSTKEINAQIENLKEKELEVFFQTFTANHTRFLENNIKYHQIDSIGALTCPEPERLSGSQLTVFCVKN